jgi:hypothetical protein
VLQGSDQEKGSIRPEPEHNKNRESPEHARGGVRTQSHTFTRLVLYHLRSNGRMLPKLNFTLSIVLLCILPAHTLPWPGTFA